MKLVNFKGVHPLDDKIVQPPSYVEATFIMNQYIMRRFVLPLHKAQRLPFHIGYHQTISDHVLHNIQMNRVDYSKQLAELMIQSIRSIEQNIIGSILIMFLSAFPELVNLPENINDLHLMNDLKHILTAIFMKATHFLLLTINELNESASPVSKATTPHNDEHCGPYSFGAPPELNLGLIDLRLPPTIPMHSPTSSLTTTISSNDDDDAAVYSLRKRKVSAKVEEDSTVKRTSRQHQEIETSTVCANEKYALIVVTSANKHLFEASTDCFKSIPNLKDLNDCVISKANIRIHRIIQRANFTFRTEIIGYGNKSTSKVQRNTDDLCDMLYLCEWCSVLAKSPTSLLEMMKLSNYFPMRDLSIKGFKQHRKPITCAIDSPRVNDNSVSTNQPHPFYFFTSPVEYFLRLVCCVSFYFKKSKAILDAPQRETYSSAFVERHSSRVKEYSIIIECLESMTCNLKEAISDGTDSINTGLDEQTTEISEMIDNAIQIEGEHDTASNGVAYPLFVSIEVYNVVKDVFMNEKSFKQVNASLLELFGPYPPNWEYPKLGIVAI